MKTEDEKLKPESLTQPPALVAARFPLRSTTETARDGVEALHEILRENARLKVEADRLRIEASHNAGETASLRIQVLRLNEHLEHYRRISIEQATTITNLFTQCNAAYNALPTLTPDPEIPDEDVEKIAARFIPKKEHDHE